MWDLSVSGHGAGGVRYDVGGAGQNLGGVSRAEEKKDDVEVDKNAVAQMLKQLDEAEKGNKNQTAQDLRDKLNEKRKELGEEKFKEILEALKKDASSDLLALLKKLFPDFFPDEPSPAPAPAPAPAPSPSPNGRGGDGGGRVNPSNYGSSESMSNKPFTEGARYTDYKPDKSNPGKKPGMGREPGNIWSGFKQGPDGNCVTVSAIKAAMMKFGQKPTDIFKDVKEAGDGYDVQMRDGFQLHLSKGELRQAAQQARFMGDDPAMITDANFLYAASAKRAQMENNDNTGGSSFLQATQTLNDGEDSLEGLDRLGLKSHVRRTTSDELARGAVGVVDDGSHSMAVIGGQIELWGRRGSRPNQPNAFALF
ncbi:MULTISPECIES: hypothetical protein [Pseudomonas]|uniref:Type III secretion effector protein n=2 Tax=Pseudomonas TaxID=286 RepID=A0A0W0HRX9_PSEFL|nr:MULTISPECIES: hypothetical protein [Pseudomonas]KTB63551.1 hypothetical protein AO063_10185 [Pseudomonas fluorescens ICMP 11288]RMQ81527.1 hypothetical protein ALP97_00018 [Pseudomonas salomonii]